MVSELTNLITQVIERFQVVIAHDQPLRSSVQQLLGALLSDVASVPEQPDIESESLALITASCSSTIPPRSEPEQIPQEVAEAQQTTISSHVGEFRLIATSCRLKAMALRWVLEQHGLAKEWKDFGTAPPKKELRAQANALPRCVLWMLHSSFQVPTDPSLLSQLAGGFDTLGGAAELMANVNEEDPCGKDFWKRAACLLAEAQSAVMSGVRLVCETSDSDQQAAYWSLRAEVHERGVYIPKYLRNEDFADPALWKERAKRLDEMVEEHRLYAGNARCRAGTLNCMRNHLKVWLEHSSDHDRDRVIQCVEQLVSNGVPPSNTELREVLFPAANEFLCLDSPSQGVQLVQREIRQYLLSSVDDDNEVTEDRLGADVAEAARLLRGRSVVVIGGEARPHAQQAFRDAFGVSVTWVDTRPHQSIRTFEHYIKSPDVAAVLLLIRWTSHSHGEIKAVCEHYGKAFARIPGGYNPNQVARHIVGQCGPHLMAEAKRVGISP